MSGAITNKEIIRNIDSSDMFRTLQDFPNQCRQAVEIGRKAPQMQSEIRDKIIILGMGGSAIAGDILSSYISTKTELRHLSVTVNRDYKIPGNLNSDSAVIASSYSGGTEETITGVRAALKHTNNISFITTGGILGEIADEHKLPKTIIPSGFMPRCALGYSFFPMLSLITKSLDINAGVLSDIDNDIQSVMDMLEEKAVEYSELNDSNIAIQIAKKLKGRIPVIYSSSLLSSVNLRWRCQIQENAKHLCWGHVLPEMNHNEINSWTNPKTMTNNFVIITMEEKSDFPKLKTRFEAVREILKSEVSDVISINDEHDNLLTRLFSTIYLGDWVSYYLAILNGEDPTPIPLISKLKEILSTK